ncbi:MAG: SOS response-associated peptidase family protein [Flavisolibacter sp.]|jgi:putative SOS response-associated peptidase YedK|nr:SOS response-associated peptidase family protein [Flavisolibacter sp.]
MCYDVSFASGVNRITEYFPGIDMNQVQMDPALMLHIQAQAYRKYPVVLLKDEGYQLHQFEWGIIAEYMDTPEKIKKSRASMCNARSEKIFDDKKSYWYRIRKQRCLVPVTGIFEHREVKGFKNKIPYFIRLKSRELFFLPGLYHYPQKADVETGEVTGTFTIVTRAANSLMQQIHNSGDQAFRMPLFLTRDLEKEWLKNDINEDQLRHIINFEMSSDELEYFPVYTIRTTKERPDGLGKTDPYPWQGLPVLGTDSAQPSLFS